MGMRPSSSSSAKTGSRPIRSRVSRLSMTAPAAPSQDLLPQPGVVAEQPPAERRFRLPRGCFGRTGPHFLEGAERLGSPAGRPGRGLSFERRGPRRAHPLHQLHGDRRVEVCDAPLRGNVGGFLAGDGR